jgi:hypothetical protein
MKQQIQKELWKKELEKLPKKQINKLVKDKDTMEFKDDYINKESEKLGNQIIDTFQLWYDDMKFKKVRKGKLNEK